MAYTASMLGWSVYEYQSAFTSAGQLTYLKNNLQFVLDYLAACWNGSTYTYQIGSGSADHSWWGPVEVIEKETQAGTRPAYTASTNASAVMAQTSAALALGYYIFGNSTYLTKAQQLFTRADADRSDANYTAASGFYNSWSGPIDELQWAAIWLYIATGNSTYLAKAESYVPLLNRQGQTTDIEYQWGHCWDDSHYGGMLMLAKLTGKQEYKDFVNLHLDWWAAGAKGFTPGGLAWLDTWGSIRYASTAAFLAFVYSDWSGGDATRRTSYRAFAEKQIAYALGDNERRGSYVVGYGTNAPQHPHHRTAHSSWTDQLTYPTYHRHILYGALVGGPDQSGGYTDDVTNYTTNEVACDYNAGFVASLAKMYSIYGGSPLAGFPGTEPRTHYEDDEFFVEAKINSSGTNYTEIKALLNNRSAWPARLISDLRFRYFMDLTEVFAAGYTASNITIGTNYVEFPVTITGPTQYSGNIYYIQVRFNDGTSIYPGGQSEFSAEVQVRISAPVGTTFWNAANDPSYQGLTSTETKTPYIPVYNGTTLIFGQEPGGSTPTPTPTVTPTPTPTPTVTPTPTPTPTVTPTPTPTPTPTVTPTPTPTPTSTGTLPCSNPTSITLPYTRNGSGDYCWSFSGTVSYVNSWNLAELNINGMDCTNKWVSGGSLPAPINGLYYVHYRANYSWGHVEINGSSTSTPTPTPTVTPTPTPTPTVTPTPTPTATPTPTPTPTVTPTPTPTPTVTPTPTPTPTSTGTLPCSNPTTISIPYTRDGSGDYCWSFSGTVSYVNSWNLAELNINGVDFTNKWVSGSSLPAKINGLYYVHYRSNYAWGHVEIR